jgi:hypothetical protein
MKPHTFMSRVTRPARHFMCSTVLLLVALLVLHPRAHGQLVNGRFVTSLYTWEKFDTVNSSKTYLRGFQNVQLAIAEGDVSLNTYLQGAVNTDGSVGLIRAYNLYLRWANIGKAVDVSLGRQAIYAGAGYGTIDGISARLRLLEGRVTVTGYGGAAPSQDFSGVRKDYHDNLNFGGQVVTTAIPGARVGVSYLNRSEKRDPYWTLRARDSSFNAVPYYVTFQPEAEELVSGDACYTYAKLFSVYGRYDYDVHDSKTARIQAGGRVTVTPDVALTADYMHRLPRVSYNSIFSAFTLNAVDEIEGGVEYSFSRLVRGFARLASVSYSDEKSTRWTVGVNAGYGSVSYSGSNGYAGELQSFTLQGMYPLLDNMVVPSVGISFASYRLSPEDSRNDAWSLVLGGTVRPSRTFSFDVQGQWMTNTVYARDLRALVKLNYWFAERLSLFGQEVGQ